MKKTLFIFMGLIVVVLVGYRLWQREEPGIPIVETTIIKRGEITSSLTDVGRITSSSKTTIFAQTGGVIKKVLVDEGDRVRKNEELARFDLREAENSLSQAENRLRQITIGQDTTGPLSR
ncbi:MAG: HlyD family efflux transporter periplasmic adaptor subunit [bacterium]|nr:HlyD family efflux transporter periplasmic adaptor subunit [bacterium]